MAADPHRTVGERGELHLPDELLFLWAVVEPAEVERAGRTPHDDLGDLIRIGGVRPHPRPRPRIEHVRQPLEALTDMHAEPRLPQHLDPVGGVGPGDVAPLPLLHTLFWHDGILPSRETEGLLPYPALSSPPMSDADRPSAPIDLSTGRLEAFSDAVIAVIITILALGLHPPVLTTKVEVLHWLPNLWIFLLSFTFIAIYWNNHHHLLRATTRINGAVMWANMGLLFCLSLIPVATEWVHLDGNDAVPAAAFGVVSLAAALAYTVLVRTIIWANGKDSLVGTAVHADLKGNISLLLYAAGIALAGVNFMISYALYAAVAIMWLVPDRRFLHEHGNEEAPA